MVGFRRAVAGAQVNRIWDNEGNAVAFSLGTKGFVAISREIAAIDTMVPSALATGTYCDVLTGGVNGKACAGTSVTVNAFGVVRVRLEPNSAIAIHVGAKP
jgi:alpha-amylase